MCDIEYISPSSISNLSNQETESILCVQCKNIAFRPVMCTCCKKLYCQSHKVKCKQGGIIIKQISSEYATHFMNLDIKCNCTPQTFKYIHYLDHKHKCPKPKFKSFYLISENGDKLGLSKVYSASIYYNLKDGYSQFTLGDYKFDMIKMICYPVQGSISLPQGESFKIGFNQQDPPTMPIWLKQDDTNHYKPYFEIDQHQIQEKYDYLMKKKKQNPDNEYSGGNFMNINLNLFISFTNDKEQKVYRKMMKQQM